MEDAGIGRLDVGFGCGSLIVKAPEFRHDGDHAIVDADGEDVVKSGDEKLGSVRGRGGFGDLLVAFAGGIGGTRG